MSQSGIVLVDEKVVSVSVYGDATDVRETINEHLRCGSLIDIVPVNTGVISHGDNVVDAFLGLFDDVL